MWFLHFQFERPSGCLFGGKQNHEESPLSLTSLWQKVLWEYLNSLVGSLFSVIPLLVWQLFVMDVGLTVLDFSHTNSSFFFRFFCPPVSPLPVTSAKEQNTFVTVNLPVHPYFTYAMTASARTRKERRKEHVWCCHFSLSSKKWLQKKKNHI